MDSGSSPKRRRVAMLLPNNMAVRNVLQTPVLDYLAKADKTEITFLTPFQHNANLIAAQHASNIGWRQLSRPMDGDYGLLDGRAAMVGRRVVHRILQRTIGRWAGFGNLVFRFNEIQGFKGHLRKKKLPPEKLNREALAGNFPDSRLGRPFPRSKTLLRLLYSLYYTTWYSEPQVEAFFDLYQPDTLVLYHVQVESIRPYVSAARRRKLPILGIVGSWDQPTSKGPLCPSISRYAVQTQKMREELHRFHGVDPSLVSVTGWPSMDINLKPDLIKPRDEFLAELGLNPNQSIILFGANASRLGFHEPSITQRISNWIQDGGPQKPATLILRPHPVDSHWKERFAHLHNPPNCLVFPAEAGRLDFLANLLKHSAVVLASTGSILLDAVSVDTCAIGLSFDGDLQVDYLNSIARSYEQDHYVPVVASGGIRLAKSFEELFSLIERYLSDSGVDAEGRIRLRAEQLEPLDGKSSQRLADLIVESAYWPHERYA
jgi:hypothetical protein